jgi:hypothetical protein
MRTRGFGLVALAVLAALVTAVAISTTVGAHPKRFHRAHFHPNLLTARMTGAQEVPGPGDADGRGRAVIKLLPHFDAVCFRLSWRNIENPTLAHIHPGRRGVANPPVVTLFSGQADRKGCVNDVDASLIRAIRRNPRRYYVNIHNGVFPDGAIRGQLRRFGPHRHHGNADHDD